ncbi:MAG: arylesterase, partial [Nitrospina sp.]|nr:arylesterase [Nitrospina sp.]
MRMILLNYNQTLRIIFVLGLLAVGLPTLAFAKERSVVLALGDSLTAGFGVESEENYPSQLQLKIKAAGFLHKVVNAGVSGDTTAGGVRRIRWLMKHEPEIVILALGANDGLRGLSIDEMRKNLETMIGICREHNARIL